MRYLIAILLLGTFILPLSAFAAWAATESFESYADGNNLDTRNGGSGWSGAWSESSAGRYVISNASAADSTTLSARHNSTGVNGIEPTASRSFTAVSDGSEMVFYMKKTVHGVDGNYVYLLNGATAALYIGFDPSGNIQAGHSGGETALLSSSSADTWYKITIEVSASSYRAKVDAGSYSSSLTYLNSVSTGVSAIRLNVGAAGNGDYIWYVDQIGAAAVAASAPSITSDLVFFE